MTRARLAFCLFLALLHLASPAASFARTDGQASLPVATVTAPAPIFVTVGFHTPMRVAAVGTRLNVVGSEGEWTQVQFQDPQFGLRTGWVQTTLVRIERPELQPMDLSVPSPAPGAPADSPRGRDRTTASPAEVEQVGDTSPSRGSEGFWFNVGLGWGSAGCEECLSRDNGLSGGLSLGGAVSNRVLLGVGTTGFAKSIEGELLSIGTLDARIRVYPSLRSGFFLNGGLGVGTFSYADDTEFGLGLMLGVGWDIRVGRNVSLTPFWNGGAMQNSTVDANFGQIGIGVTIH